MCIGHVEFGRHVDAIRRGGFFLDIHMATRAKSVCRHPGCGKLIDGPGYCAPHVKQVRQQSDAERGTAHERGYDSKWRKAREGFLRNHPLCECNECLASGRLIASAVVDHTIPHRLKEAKDSGDPEAIAKAIALFWDRKNWKAMSKACHDRKTAREDGGFGR